MFEKIVQKLLNKIIGEYVDDFNSENLNIGLWKGVVNIQNVRLKKDIIKKLNLPFNIKYSKLGLLKVNIPWSSLSSSKIQVFLQGLEILITEVSQDQWQCKNHKIIEQRKKQIQSFCQAIIAEFNKKTEQQSKQNEEQGYFNNVIVRIIDNLQIVVKDIHIRFQDQITRKFSFGVTLQQLKIYTVNKYNEPQFIDRTKKMYENQPLRKKLLLSNLGFYWNEKIQFFSKADPHNEMIKSIYRKQSKQKQNMSYLILMSFNAMLFQRESGKQFEQPEINLLIEFNELKVQVTNLQLQQIINLGERFQKFKNQIRAQNRKKLTQLQMIANRQIFLQLFPKFYSKKCSNSELQQIDFILERMEVQNFEAGIKKYLQDKQKQIMIQQKKQKSKGWFSGPKQLTEKQISEIQKFVTQNFGKQFKLVKRPADYYYIKVNFNLKYLQIAIANQLENNIKEGIKLKFNQIKMQFCLREQGYLLNFAMADTTADIFKQNILKKELQQTINLVTTFSSALNVGKSKQYVRLQVFGNPLHKKGIDTELIVRTEELLIQFHPKIIKIAKQFSSIQLNAENSQAALQAYGQIKNIASNAANESLKKPFQKKNFISLDVNISAINLILYFDPYNVNSDIWALKLGQSKVYADPEILKRLEYNFDEPMQKYGIKFQKMSFTHFPSMKAFLYSRQLGHPADKKQIVLDDLGIDLQCQLFKDSTQAIPKIRLKTVIHNFEIRFSEFTYFSIQNIAKCFQVINQNQNQNVLHQNDKYYEKSEVMKNAIKIGIVFEQSKDPKKFIAVLNSPYLYLYKDKNDKEYNSYYYLKNCQIIYNNETLPQKKAFQVKFKNSVNQLILGFQKAQKMEEWVKAIKSIDLKQQFKSLIEQKEMKLVKKQSSSKLDPDRLIIEIVAKFQRLCINTLLQDDKKIEIAIKSLESRIKAHQSKNILQFSLESIEVQDNIQIYKNKELAKLLYSAAVEGKQRLIYVNVVNFGITHPSYQRILADVNVEFGKLICNYKPETMERIMNFYIPKDSLMAEKRKQKGSQLTVEEKQTVQKQKKKRKKQIIQNELKKGIQQTFILSLKIKIQQISGCLVNRNNKVMFAKLGLDNFNFAFAMSSRRMIMSGSLNQMWFADYSNYPYTIYEEQENYNNKNFIVESYNKSRDMLRFDIQMLQIPKQGKSMFIQVYVFDVKVSYIQQPVLRAIFYILQQILPSLTPPQDLTQTVHAPKNDFKPEISTMVLVANIENVLALVQPRSKDYPNQFLQMYVNKILVKNKSVYRQFLKTKSVNDENVLVQNYFIQMKSIKIVEKFNGKVTILTNDLDFNVSCDLIQNPNYYRKTYKDRFDPGMRIQCELSPFLMCINHEDYNFIMKCIYWNIIYDDNAEGYFSKPIVRPMTVSSGTPVSQPIHFGLSMPKIILCITENNFPMSVLLLNQMRYDLTLNQTGMYMIFKMKHLHGTSISKSESQQNKTIERGVFNSFGYLKQHKTSELSKMDLGNLVNIFSRNELIHQQTSQYVVYFKMCTITNKNESDITIKIKNINIGIQIKTLITLSKLALLQQYIQPPKSTIKPVHEKAATQNNSMNISIDMENFLGCLGDEQFQNYIVMEGVFYINLKLFPSFPEQQLISRSKNHSGNGKFHDLTSYQIKIKNYCLYFSNMQELKSMKKRHILMPINIFLMMRKFYTKYKDTIFLQTEVDGMLDRIIFECSIKDTIMINKIIQQNIQALNQANKQQNSQNQKSKVNEKQIMREPQTQINSIKESVAIDIQTLNRTIKQIQNKIKNKTKGTVKIEPIQVRVINDCQHNFMPIFSFMAQQSCLIFSANPIKTQLVHNLTLKLQFFNPRSANWEPVIQMFQILFQYQVSASQYGQKSKIQISSSQIEQLKQLKLNVSTQLISNLLATMEIARKQQKQLLMHHGQFEKQVVQISPYIIENKSHEFIKIKRTVNGVSSDMVVPPLFKGQVRMNDSSELLKFQVRGKNYEISMEKFGYGSIPKLRDIHLQFKIDKLNRIISFVDKYTIRNATNVKIFCIRYNEQRSKIEDSLQIQPQDSIPFKAEWYAQFSFNKKSFTPPCKITSLSKMIFLKAQSQKFKFSITQKNTVMDHKVISLRAPFLISNCLPKDIQLQFISNGKHISTREISAQTSHEVFANEDIYNLKFKLIAEGFYWSDEFSLNALDISKQNQLTINDRQKGYTKIKYIFIKDEKRCQFKLSIFCPAFILSELEEEMHIYGNLLEEERKKAIQKFHILPGQSQYWRKASQDNESDKNRAIDKITIVGSQIGSKLRICGDNCIVDFSQPFSINSIGIHQARVVVERQIGVRKISVFTILALQIQLKKMSMKSNIYSKQITIRYRYIVCNKTQFLVFIKQQGSQKLYFYAEKGEKKPFYYTVPSIGIQTRNMIIKTPETHESLPLPSNTLGVVYFRLELKSKKGTYLYFKLNTQQIKSYIFYEITQIQYKDLPYQAIVKSEKFKVFVPHFEKILTKNGDPLLFINENPAQGFKLFMIVALIETQQTLQVTVDTDNLNFKQILKILNKNTNRFVNCMVSIIFNDSKKYIVIEQLAAIEQIVEYQIQSIHLKLQKIGISLIHNHGQVERPYESFFLFLYNIQLLNQKTNLLNKFQARLQFLQFDQQQPFNIPDPVIVTPSKYKQFISQDKKDHPKWIFNSLIQIDTTFIKNLFIKEIKIQINDLVVRASTYFIKLVLNLTKQLDGVFKSQKGYLINKQLNTWKNVQIPQSVQKTFIRSIQIAPFTIQVSAQLRLNELDIESVVFFGTIINALGVVITNIEDAPIVFDGIDLKNCIDSVQGIQQKLMAHYKTSVIRQLYKVFGSLNIIGNPVSLFKNISAGVKAFREKPVQGFVKGPLEFGIGLADGASSLIAHSVGGALNSVQKVTGTIASGLAVLTFDKQFQQARQKQRMKKPRHVIQGIQKGGKAVFHGFKQGITGVFTKPIQNTKKQGFVGFLKGTAQGMAGLVVKPVTGVVDFASKTTQGLKNTALYLEDKPNENRIRYPRVFYTECSAIREYSMVDSKLISIVNKTRYEEKYGFDNPIFISTFMINIEEYILILKQYVVMIRVSNEKIQWAIPMENVIVCKQNEEQVRIISSNRRQWYSKKVNAVIQFSTKEDLTNFINILNQLKVNINATQKNQQED